MIAIIIIAILVLASYCIVAAGARADRRMETIFGPESDENWGNEKDITYKPKHAKDEKNGGE